MAATTTLRVRPATRDRLNALASQDQVSAPEMLDRLVEQEERNRLLRQFNDDCAALRSDDEAWSAFKGETAQWDDASAPLGA